MVREKRSKILTLAVIALCVALHLSGIPAGVAGMSDCSPFINRFLYHFFHASWLHLAINIWCIFSIVFMVDISTAVMLACYVLASLYPPILLPDMPIVGLSGLCFALMGYLATRMTIWSNLYLLAFIVLGFFLFGVASGLHLWSYLCGIAINYIASWER